MMGRAEDGKADGEMRVDDDDDDASEDDDDPSEDDDKHNSTVDLMPDASSLQARGRKTRGRAWKGTHPPGHIPQHVPDPSHDPYVLELPNEDPNSATGNLFYSHAMNTVSFHAADRVSGLWGGWWRVKNERKLMYRYKNIFLNPVQFDKLCQSNLPTPCPIAAEEQHFEDLNDKDSLVQIVLKHSRPSMNHFFISQYHQVSTLLAIVTLANMTAGTLSLIEFLIDHGISTMYEERIEDKDLGVSEYVPRHLIDYPAVNQRVVQLCDKPNEMNILVQIIVLFSQKKRDLVGNDGYEGGAVESSGEGKEEKKS